MIEEQMTVGLVVERRELTGEWGGHAWRPITIFPQAADAAPWTPLGSSKTTAKFYAGPVQISLFSTDTANYRDNLESGAPKLWVVMRPDGPEPPVKILAVTADPAEGEGNTEAGSNVVETIDMPPEIAGVVAAFIQAHHVERPIIKRKRDGKPHHIRWRDGGTGQSRPRGKS